MGLGRIMQAGMAGLQAGFFAAMRAYEDPSVSRQEESYQWQVNEYALLWAYYNGSMFDRVARVLNSYSFGASGWALYKSTYNLYRDIRLIYNPTRRLVDFYAGAIYPGSLSEDGASLPDGVQLAIPFSSDTDPELKNAVAQFWQWSNFQAKKSVLVRYGAALGSVFLEIVDDSQTGKISAEVLWPGFIQNLVLDHAGNVQSYTVQYAAFDQSGSYIYRKDVDQELISYYRDGSPYDYGQGQTIEHGYGFAPGVWIKHQDTGGQRGASVIAGSFSKIDELNNLASHIHDEIHKEIGAPKILWTSGYIQNLFNQQNRTVGDQSLVPPTNQESVLMLRGPADGHVDSLAGTLPLADCATYMQNLLAEIEQDHPELTFYKELRSMSQVTGPAATRLSGDVGAKVAEAMANYDQGLMSLFRMIVAIGGMRANSGDWGTLTRQQQKFLPFDLTSYASGDLDMAIVPRALLTPTKSEIAQEKTTMWTGINAASTAGVPLEFSLRDAGYSDQQLAQLGADHIAEIQRDQMLSQEDTTPTVQQ